MADIFISYARSDREQIEGLAAALEGAGYSVWWDREISGGDQFSKRIEKELNEASVVVVAWSQSAVESTWVKDEATIAKSAEKLIPISLDDTEAPLGFRQYQSIDLSNWKVGRDFPAGILSSIAALAEKEATPISSPSRDLSARPPLFLAAGVAAVVLVAVVAFFALQKDKPSETEAAEVAGVQTPDEMPEAATIAVLAFSDLSPQGDQVYFSEGIAEEILNVLAKVKGLRVASRTSSFAYKSQSSTAIPEIAEALNVRHVLEGSVRKAGDRVRITAQLIDGAEDKHLWSETFDETLTTDNIFDVQDQISNAIVKALSAHLPVSVSDDLAVRVNADTQDLNAYELYLKAHRQFLNRTRTDNRETLKLFEQAIAADPTFARAWAGYAALLAVLPNLLGNQDGEADDAQAEEAAAKALDLDPDLALPYATLGLIAMDQKRYKDADRFLTTSLAKDPLETTAYHWRAMLYRKLGHFKHAAMDAAKCLEIDPQYMNCRNNLKVTSIILGDFQTAFDLERIDLLDMRYTEYLNLDYAIANRGGDIAIFYHYSHAVSDRSEALRKSLPYYIQAVREPDSDLDAAYEKVVSFKKDVGQKGFDDGPMAQMVDWIMFNQFDTFRENLDRLPEESLRAFSHWNLWLTEHPTFIGSDLQKAILEKTGVHDHWRAHGFPYWCKPVGTDDFECDLELISK